MNTRLDKDGAVNRLVDLAVEAVSLVNHAGNYCKGLIVESGGDRDTALLPS